MKVAEDIMSGLHATVLCKSTLTTKHKQTDTARIQIEDFANDFADIINIGQSYEGRDMNVLAITKVNTGTIIKVYHNRL